MVKKLTIVTPGFNEEKNVAKFYQAVQKVVSKIKPAIEMEYWFIDDGSSDGTVEEIKKLQKKDKKVHFVSFSRNFGKEAALYAGLINATGDYVAVMDIDLQDPPELLPEMLKDLASGQYDAVGSRRANRLGESPIRSWFSEQFYKFFSLISKTQLVDGARDFRVMTRQMVDAVLVLPENQRFSKGIFSWIGFKTKYLEYDNIERKDGNSNWSFWSLISYAIEGIVAFSTVPLTLVSLAGLLTLVIAFFAAIFVVGRTIFYGNSISGWASTVTLLLGFGGLQLFATGIVGRYLAAIYNETKRRPVYIEKEKK